MVCTDWILPKVCAVLILHQRHGVDSLNNDNLALTKHSMGSCNTKPCCCSKSGCRTLNCSSRASNSCRMPYLMLLIHHHHWNNVVHKLLLSQVPPANQLRGFNAFFCHLCPNKTCSNSSLAQMVPHQSGPSSSYLEVVRMDNKTWQI